MSALELAGVEKLRRAVRILDNNSESFNYRFTAHELLAICEALLRSEHDISPSEWTDRQVREAIKGIPPKWGEDFRGNLKPVYTKKK